MSATIGANKLKFTIFGVGHNYTLNNSGTGNEKTIFSHPFVPLGSTIYAGQFFFEVPVYDENDPDAEPVMTDAVRFDNAHCSFLPALGTTFDTEGEVTVKASYRREYIFDDETILVERNYEQKIQVVDHGNVVNHSTYGDIYEDGYGFIHNDSYWVDNDPQTIPEDEYDFGTYTYLDIDYGTKLSSLPWRTTGLYGGDSGMGEVTDLTELAYADASTIKTMRWSFACCGADDFSPLASWDVSNCTDFESSFQECHRMTNVSFLSKWKMQGSLHTMFAFCDGLKTLDGLENWDVSGVTNMSGMFQNCESLKDVSAVKKWDVSHVTTMGGMFYLCPLDALEDYSCFENWDVSSVTTMRNMFYASSKNVKTFKGLENWDVSNVTNMNHMFFGASVWILSYTEGSKLVDISAIADWDVSKVTDFGYMFANKIWLADLSPIEGWDVSSGKYFNNMFQYCGSLLTPPDFSDWDFSQATNMTSMFGSPNSMYNVNYPPAVGKMWQIYHEWTQASYVDYNRTYVYWIPDAYATALTHDASSASNWNVPLTGTNAFSGWSNRPSWG